MGAPKLEHTELNVFRFLDPRDCLKDVYEQLKQEGKARSYDSFSEWLGFGRNSYSHQVISGVRTITEKAAHRICDALALTGNARKYFVATCNYHYAKASEEREAAIQEILTLRRDVMVSDLDAAQIEYFSEWYHAVVRELVATPDFSPDAAWIAARVNPELTEDEAAYSFKLLQRIGYVEFDAKQGRWVQSDRAVNTPPQVRSLALQRFHRQMMERAREAIFDVPSAERDISAVTLPLTDEQFSALKKQLIETRNTVLEGFSTLNAKNATSWRVYQLNTQLFPVTKRGSR